ncbi:hypothetical protein ACP3W2_27515, partial [Salmonella enterica]|uniref:hypothetical protein n=1 Tax=Salmonella enterica TaxID=28901 RepID=UPI003CFB6F85
VPARVTFGATSTTPVTIAAADYVVVDTGDPLPDGCDAVVMIENVVYPEGCTQMDLGQYDVRVFEASTPWQHVRQIGE